MFIWGKNFEMRSCSLGPGANLTGQLSTKNWLTADNIGLANNTGYQPKCHTGYIAFGQLSSKFCLAFKFAEQYLHKQSWMYIRFPTKPALTTILYSAYGCNTSKQSWILEVILTNAHVNMI